MSMHPGFESDSYCGTKPGKPGTLNPPAKPSGFGLSTGWCPGQEHGLPGRCCLELVDMSADSPLLGGLPPAAQCRCCEYCGRLMPGKGSAGCQAGSG